MHPPDDVVTPPRHISQVLRSGPSPNQNDLRTPRIAAMRGGG
jgi:hypothetical protein